MDTDEIRKEDGVVASKCRRKLPSSFWCWLIAVGVLVVVLMPATTRCDHSYRAEAIMNAGQISKMLFLFAHEYKSYPNDQTAKSISLAKDLGIFDLGKPGSSNYYFRQLLVTGYNDQEKPFDLGSYQGNLADNLMDGSKLLESGECAYSYVVWESAKNLHEKAPLVMTPLIPGKRQFDYQHAKKYYGGKVVILHFDTSVGAYPVDRSGRVVIDGKDFFDPSQPYWGGQKPRIAWPE